MSRRRCAILQRARKTAMRKRNKLLVLLMVIGVIAVPFGHHHTLTSTPHPIVGSPSTVSLPPPAICYLCALGAGTAILPDISVAEIADRSTPLPDPNRAQPTEASHHRLSSRGPPLS